MDSPRLAWIKKHGVKTHCAPHCCEAPWCAWFAGNEYVGNPGIPDNPDACGYGHSEDEAIQDLAVGYNVPLWNEEPHKLRNILLETPH